MKSVDTAVLASCALLVDQSCDVSCILDLLPAAPASRVDGDLVIAVEHAHGLGARIQHEGAAHVRVRHRVVIEVESRIRCLADVDLHPFFSGERIGRQLEKPRLLLCESLSHRA